MFWVLDSSKRRGRRLDEGSEGARPSRRGWGAIDPSLAEGGERGGSDERLAAGLNRVAAQAWQSSEVRRGIFFSAAYLSAADLTIGLRIDWSACNQSELNTHLLPSQVWMRA